jgi:hypothetical protein
MGITDHHFEHFYVGISSREVMWTWSASKPGPFAVYSGDKLRMVIIRIWYCLFEEMIYRYTFNGCLYMLKFSSAAAIIRITSIDLLPIQFYIKWCPSSWKGCPRGLSVACSPARFTLDFWGCSRYVFQVFLLILLYSVSVWIKYSNIFLKTASVV